MITITVIGPPQPQGSKKAFYNRRIGRAIIVEDNAKNRPWRESVKHAALAVMGRDSHLVPAVSGPVEIDVIFTMPRPKKYEKSATALPSARPDIDKLLRSSGDALTDAGVYQDDSNVVVINARKLYAGDRARGAMDIPGAVIVVRPAYSTSGQPAKAAVGLEGWIEL